MAHSEGTHAPDTTYGATVALTTKAGTHVFTPRDRLWVLDASESTPRPVTEVRPGDLVAFLGRVLSVRFVPAGSTLDAERPRQQGDSDAQLPSVAA